MRKFFTFLCLILTGVTTAQNTFKTLISIGNFYQNSSKINDVVQINDGSYIGVGYQIDSVNLNILIAKFNPHGVLLFSKLIATDDDNDGICIIKTMDGGFAVGGILNGELGILKFDKNFNLNWQKMYLFSVNEGDGAKLVQTPEDGFIIVGDVYDADVGGGAGYLIKTDSMGKLLFARQYFDFSENSDNEIVDIVATNDGNYALLSVAYGYDTLVDQIDTAYLIKINSSGSVLWSRYISTSTHSNSAASLLQASDGGIVIAGSAYKFFNDGFDEYEIPQMLMTKFNASGTLLWSKMISTVTLSRSYANAVLEDKAGGYIFAGEFGDLKADSGAVNDFCYIVKLNSAGILQWTKTFDKSSTGFDGEFATQFTALISTADGGYAASAATIVYRLNNSLGNGILYKFDGNFGTCGEAGSSGGVVDEGAALVKSVTVHNINSVALDVNVIQRISIDTSINYCCSAVTTYTFTGSGNWSDKANWSSNGVPPSPLSECSEIFIDPPATGECILNVPILIPQGDKIIVQTGKKFKVKGNLIIR